MSKHDDPIVRLAGHHVFQIFRNAGPDNPLVFHNFSRTRALIDACRGFDENLLLFTNDAPWSLEEYRGRMNRLATNWPALQQTMVEDMYFIRKLLLERAKALRISYDVFIVGLAISVLAFAIAIIRR